ncbi:MAG: twin-arginine translocase TatA/TatE family subunit [Actinomycetota bacterium]
MIAMFDSPAEIGIVLLVVLLLFGGSQLPKLAKNIGKAQKEFKDGLAEAQREVTPAEPQAAPAAQPQADPVEQQTPPTA